jgi:protein-arginine kinase activator protein McsA
MDEQKDAFYLINDILDGFQEMKELFRFETINESKCENCAVKLTFKDGNAFFLSLTRFYLLREKKNMINFNDLILKDKIENYVCDQCSQKNTKLIIDKKFIFSDYLIIRIEISYRNKQILGDILNFDPDHVKIEGSENEFFVKAAILFYPANINQTDKGGHYIACRRFNRKWAYINDNNVTFSDYFVSHLRNVYILFLEKINV